LSGITVLLGILVLFLLPDTILSAKKFSTEDKAVLVAQGKQNRTGILNRHVKWYQIREALLDPKEPDMIVDERSNPLILQFNHSRSSLVT
jgi:hypothetical protein